MCCIKNYAFLFSAFFPTIVSIYYDFMIENMIVFAYLRPHIITLIYTIAIRNDDAV